MTIKHFYGTGKSGTLKERQKVYGRKPFNLRKVEGIVGKIFRQKLEKENKARLTAINQSE